MSFILKPIALLKPLILGIVAFLLVAYHEGMGVAFVVFGVLWTIFFNGWTAIEILGWVVVGEKPKRNFRIVVYISIASSIVAAYFGYSPHVLIFGFGLPIGLALVIRLNDRLKSSLSSIWSKHR